MQLCGEVLVYIVDPAVLTRLRGMARDCGIGPQDRALVESRTARTATGTIALRINLWMKRLGLTHKDVLTIQRGKTPRRKPRDVNLDEREATTRRRSQT